MQAVHELHPDVILMDIRMPIMDGIEATRLITGDSQLGGVRVLILTTFDLDEYVYAALQAGASGFLLKDAPPERMFDAVRVIAAGDALLDPAATRRLIESVLDRRTLAQPSVVRRLEALTHREREVLTLVGRGLSNAEISAGTRCQRSDNQDAHIARDGQARGSGSSAARRTRLRRRPRPPRRWLRSSVGTTHVPRRDDTRSNPPTDDIEKAGSYRR